MKKSVIIVSAVLMATLLLWGIIRLIMFGASVKSDIDSIKYYIKSHVNYTGTTGEYADRTEELLEEKYGEKFKVVRYGNNEATVYPESNPDLLFRAKRFAVSDLVDDDYIQEIVGLQYKKLAEEVLKDFKYHYYLDVDLEFTYKPFDAKQDVTIEEFKKVFPEKVEPNYNWYVSKEALELSNEELYKWINKVASIPVQDNSLVILYFTDDNEMTFVKEHYTECSYVTSSFYTEISNVLIVQQHMKDRKYIIDYNRFTELMNGEYIK